MIKPAHTLSVVVPVHNAERTLTATVAELLDGLADLTSRFEILIVDDGSTDQTEEVAHELTQRYPQVMVVRHAERRGIEASAQTGVVNTTGEVVVVHAGQSLVNTAELQRIWQRRDDEELVVQQCEGKLGSVSPDVFRGLMNCG